MSVRSSLDFTDNRFVIVGEPGQERTEAKDINGAPGTDTTITIGGSLKFSHPKSTIIYESDWDQISFEQKPSAGSYSVISGSPFNIEWDNSDKTTLIEVVGGASTDTYRWRFYNSQRGTYSDYSDGLSGGAPDSTLVGYVIREVRRIPGLQGITDEVLMDYIGDFQDLIYEEVPKAWWFVKEGTAISTVADTYRYSISTNWSDFLSMKFMRFNFISGSINNTYPLSYSPINEFYNLKADSTQASDDNARQWTLLPPDDSSAKGYIGIHPTPDTTACYLKPVYQFKPTRPDSFGDTLVIPQVKGYIDYVLYRIYDDIKNDVNNAGKFSQRLSRDILGLKKLARRQLGQPELFRFRGQKGWSDMYGKLSFPAWDQNRELFW